MWKRLIVDRLCRRVSCLQGGGEQGVQEVGGPAPPRQMRRPRQRGRLQGRGERPHLPAEEH